MRTVAPSSRRSTVGGGGGEDAQRGQRVHVRVQRHAQAARFHHVAERPASRRRRGGRSAGTAARRRRPSRPSLTRMSRIGQARLGQPVPHAGLSRAGGASRRRWRRRGRRTPDAPSAAGRRGPPPRWRCRRRPAGRPACRRPDRRRRRRPRLTDARSCRAQWRGRHTGGKPWRYRFCCQAVPAYSCDHAEQRGQRVQIRMAIARTAGTRRLASPTIRALMPAALGGAERAGAGAARAGAAGGAGLLRSARPVAEHRHLAACQQPGGAGRRGAGGPAAARVRRGWRAAGAGDAGLGVADRVAPRAGQHGGAAGRLAGGAAGAGRGVRGVPTPPGFAWPTVAGLGGAIGRLLASAGLAAGRDALGPVGALMIWAIGLGAGGDADAAGAGADRQRVAGRRAGRTRCSRAWSRCRRPALPIVRLPPAAALVALLRRADGSIVPPRTGAGDAAGAGDATSRRRWCRAHDASGDRCRAGRARRACRCWRPAGASRRCRC